MKKSSDCCINCFKDQWLKNKIKDSGHRGNCTYCQSRKIKCVTPEKLFDFFDPIFNLYQSDGYASIMSSFSCGGDEGVFELLLESDDDADEYDETLAELIQEDWNIFDDRLSIAQSNKLLDDIRSLRTYRKASKAWERHYSESLNAGDYWSQFTNYIKKNGIKNINKFYPETEHFTVFSEFTNISSLHKFIGDNLSKLETKIEAGSTYFRARIGDLNIKDMGAPPSDKALVGRANPKGVSYLYLSDSEKTTIGEVRPWRTARMTVAEFVIERALNVIDLSKLPQLYSPFIYENLYEAISGLTLIQSLVDDMSKPISPKQSEIDYLSTQYLSDLIKQMDYSGFIFNSSLGNGKNLVIFDSGCARPTKIFSKLIVENINYSVRRTKSLF